MTATPTKLLTHAAPVKDGVKRAMQRAMQRTGSPLRSAAAAEAPSMPAASAGAAVLGVAVQRAMKRMRTLVLNADYSPLSVCSPVRGAFLCLEKKAYRLETTELAICSEATSLLLPRVIVLSHYRSLAA